MLHFDPSRNSASPKSKLIIFIHGLVGSKKTWILSDGTKTVATYLIQNPAINAEYDFGYFEYVSNVTTPSTGRNLFKFAWNQVFGIHKAVTFNLSIEDSAKSLATQIYVNAKNYEQIVLIGHSMGGLVSKAYICEKLKQNQDHKISHFISLAVPHGGSELATFAKKYLKNHPQLKELKPLDEFLNELTTTWINTDYTIKLPETQYFLGLFDKIVPKTSSLAYDTRKNLEVHTVEQDHSSILKPIVDETVVEAIVMFLTNPSKKKARTKLLIAPPEPEKFEGRRAELTALKETLEKNNQVVLVSGMGGIGKTTLLKKFFLEQKDDYDTAIYLEIKTDFLSTFTDNIALITELGLSDTLNQYRSSPDFANIAFELLMRSMGKLSGKSLLCLDNLNEKLPENLHANLKEWKILCSSRIVLPNMKKHDLGVFTTPDAISVFATYYGLDATKLSPENYEAVRKIVEDCLANHALAIEFVAKNAAELSWSLAKTYTELREKGIKFSVGSDFTADHAKQETVSNIFEYLLKTFPIDNLSEAEIDLLLHFSVMPNLPFDIGRWHILYNEEKTKEELSLTQNKLYKKGWLTEQGEAFSMHQIVAEVCVNQKTDLAKEVIEKLNVFFNVTIQQFNHTQLVDLINYATTLSLNKLMISPELNFRLGEFYVETGNLNYGLTFFDKSKKQFDLLDNKADATVTLTRIGDIYQAQGNFEKALGYFEERAKIGEELYKANPASERLKNGLAISYEKLGSIYQAQGNFEKALGYFEEETKLFEELYKANPASESLKNGLAISYEKLGSIYQAQGNFEKALGYFEERAKIGEELYKANPASVSLFNGLAISYYKLGDVCKESGKKEEAIAYFKQSQAIWEILVEKVPSAVEFKRNLDFINELLEEILTN
jgi:tetratricopeptide (TPR) repeat protein